jgi:ssDNA-binding replication factor A large subunit
MKVSATALRQNIYSILDEALATGQSIEVERKGKVLKIVPPKTKVESKLAKLKDRNLFVGDPDDLIRVEGLWEWNELKNLE